MEFPATMAGIYPNGTMEFPCVHCERLTSLRCEYDCVPVCKDEACCSAHIREHHNLDAPEKTVRFRDDSLIGGEIQDKMSERLYWLFEQHLEVDDTTDTWACDCGDEFRGEFKWLEHFLRYHAAYICQHVFTEFVDKKAAFFTPYEYGRFMRAELGEFVLRTHKKYREHTRFVLGMGLCPCIECEDVEVQPDQMHHTCVVCRVLFRRFQILGLRWKDLIWEVEVNIFMDIFDVISDFYKKPLSDLSEHAVLNYPGVDSYGHALLFGTAPFWETFRGVYKRLLAGACLQNVGFTLF
jgi:hypothetical protein